MMNENPPITILDTVGQPENSCSCNTKIIDFDLDILGQTLQFSAVLVRKQARLADIVPLARLVSNRITDIVIRSICDGVDHIPCAQGCAACCYYLLPMSVPEAFYLKQEILARPQDQQRLMLRLCLLAARSILKHKPPKCLSSADSVLSPDESISLHAISSWYKSLKLPCPFLYKTECIIYSQRPLTCREHLVKGSARACKGKRGSAETVKMPLQMSNVLARLAANLEQTNIESIVMPLALIWCEENLARHERTWPTTSLVECFIETVKSMASKNCVTAPVPM